MATILNLNYTKQDEYYLNSIYHLEEAPTTPAPQTGVVYDGATVEVDNVDVVYDGGNP